MKRIFDILAIVVLLLATACSKEDISGNAGGNGIKISLLMNDEVTVKGDDTQGNTITDFSVWAYPITSTTVNDITIETIADDALPAAYGTINGSGTLTLNVPPDFSGAGKKYRFMAVANKTKLGKIFKARTNYGTGVEIALNEYLTYKEISTAVFDAKTGIMASLPGSDAANSMPFAHWKDVTVEESTTEIPIPVYRSVAKATFKAKLIDGSGDADLLVINSVTIKSAHNYHIPQQGFVFSPIENINGANAPEIFGDYNDLEIAQNINIGLITSDIKIKKEASAGILANATAGTFLYENHNGDAWPGGGEPSPSSSDPNTYDYGAYYLEISYQYGQDSNSDGTIDDTPKSRTNYVPLPPVVRNRSYIVDATFDIRRGNIILNYSVKNWQQEDIADGNSGANGAGDDVQNVEFSYPTFEIWPVKTIPDTNPAEYDYNQPLACYNSTGDATKDAPFQFYFRMQPHESRQWSIALADANDADSSLDNENDTFKIEIYKSSDNTINGEWQQQTVTGTSFTAIAAGDLYKISITAEGALSSAATTTANVIIIYYASWLGGYDHLLINSGGGGTLWSNSGHERHQILVTQGTDITN